MRIVGRSESQSFPYLETLLPMGTSWALEVEKEEEGAMGTSWALEVEKEEEALRLRAKNEPLDRSSDRVKQVECSGGEEASHRSYEEQNEGYNERASRSFDSKFFRKDQCQFTSSSRCYPPSSEFCKSAEVIASRRQHQRGWHEARTFALPNRTSSSFSRRQRPRTSKYGFSRESKGGNFSANLFARSQDHSGFLNHRAEVTLAYKAFAKPGKCVGDKLSHFKDHQELDECKHDSQLSVDKHSQYRYGQYSVKSELSKHNRGHGCGKKREHQEPFHVVKQCGISIDLEMIEHKEALQILEVKPEMPNDKDVASDAITTKVLSKGFEMVESSYTEELEVKNNDSITAKKHHEMLACLLFDDLKDTDEKLDGPDCEHSGSIFNNVLQASMDIDVVTEDKEARSGKVPAASTTEQCDCPSWKAFAGKLSASQHAKASHNARISSGLKKFPPVLVDVTNKFQIHASAGVQTEVQEDDVHRLSQRQRQIEFGKTSLGYERYSELIPRFKRKAKDPQTPNPKQICSKRSWDGQIRKWRRLLHAYDPPSEDGEEIAEDFSILRLHQSRLEKCLEAKEDTSPSPRCAESHENKGRIAGVDGANVGDANLTIYDDWMDS